MNEVLEALKFLSASLLAKDRIIEQQQTKIAELEKQLQAAMATKPQTDAVQ